MLDERQNDVADITDATFQTAVIERSAQVPVVVDLWAEWCGPCKQLGPILERVVAATNGAVELAKVDIEANPAVGRAFAVQSIPAVYAIVNGEVADHFIGAKSEAEVQTFVSSLVPAEAAESPDLSTLSEAELRALLESDPNDPATVTALADLLAAEGRGEEAVALLERIPESADTRRIAAVVRTGGGGDPDEMESRLNELLDRVKADDEARQQFVDLLEVMGPDDPRTAEYRRQLTSRLF